MEKDNGHSSRSRLEGTPCPVCKGVFESGDCQCPGPPIQKEKVAGKPSLSHLLNGECLLKHTKSNVRNVPDSIVSLTPSSDTKSTSYTDETKLPISKVNVGKECLNYDEEAVNVGSSSSRVGTESNIFEIDIDCVDSTRVVGDESSHILVGDRQRIEESTPVKGERRVNVPNAPQKPSTDERVPDRREYATRTPRHSCPYCSKTFRSNGKLNSHVFSHTGERPFACKHCQKAFSSKFKLVRHLLIHSEERKFLCTVCERRFLRNDHLKNHYKVHDPRKVVFRCERAGCDKEYSSALSQRKHEAWHLAQDGNLTCLLCNVKHETVSDLLMHLRRHSGSRIMKSPADRKFRCNVCERNFLTRKDVTRHLVVHTGERDFLCQFCPQRFGRKDHLIRHIKKSHHGPSKKKGGKQGPRRKREKEDEPSEEVTGAEEGEDEESESDIDVEEDDSLLLDLPAEEKTDELSDSNVPTDLEEIQTSELLMRASPQPADVMLSGPSLPVDIMTPDSSLPTDLLSPEQPDMHLFGFQAAEGTSYDTASTSTASILPSSSTALLDDAGTRDTELFEGPSQIFNETVFNEEEYKSSDFLVSGETPGELLRYLLQSDALPGFSQAFKDNSGPPKT